jgi:hypothetical protein
MPSIPVSELTVQNLTTMTIVQYLCIKAETFKYMIPYSMGTKLIMEGQYP